MFDFLQTVPVTAPESLSAAAEDNTAAPAPTAAESKLPSATSPPAASSVKVRPLVERAVFFYEKNVIFILSREQTNPCLSITVIRVHTPNG